MESTTGIDFVITWVDGGDPEWRKKKAEYSRLENGQAEEVISSIDDGDERYRDNGLLSYWFRGVEKFAPWVRKVHLVTCGQTPDWLNVDNPKLNVVRHDEIIPNEFLPTFNSNAIEPHLHRIEGLSDRFVYFNDDMFLIRSANEKDFFIGGKPCDLLAFQPVVANPANPIMSHLFLNNALVISKYFNKRENVLKQPGKYFKIGYPPLYFFYNMLEVLFPKFTGFYTVHGPFPFCKETFTELWEKEEAELLETTSHRFRSKDDLMIYLFRDWQKLKGNFHAKNLLKDFSYFELCRDNSKLYRTIRKQKKKIICINEPIEQLDFAKIKKELLEVFEEILPERSSFEKAVSEENL